MRVARGGKTEKIIEEMTKIFPKSPKIFEEMTPNHKNHEKNDTKAHNNPSNCSKPVVKRKS